MAQELKWVWHWDPVWGTGSLLFFCRITRSSSTSTGMTCCRRGWSRPTGRAWYVTFDPMWLVCLKTFASECLPRTGFWRTIRPFFDIPSNILLCLNDVVTVNISPGYLEALDVAGESCVSTRAQMRLKLCVGSQSHWWRPKRSDTISQGGLNCITQWFYTTVSTRWQCFVFVLFSCYP